MGDTWQLMSNLITNSTQLSLNCFKYLHCGRTMAARANLPMGHRSLGSRRASRACRAPQRPSGQPSRGTSCTGMANLPSCMFPLVPSSCRRSDLPRTGGACMEDGWIADVIAACCTCKFERETHSGSSLFTAKVAFSSFFSSASAGRVAGRSQFEFRHKLAEC